MIIWFLFSCGEVRGYGGSVRSNRKTNCFNCFRGSTDWTGVLNQHRSPWCSPEVPDNVDPSYKR